MFNQDYEEYMRNVLGYNPNYQNNTYRDNNYYPTQNQAYYNENLEAMYPEIYRKVYPLVMREVATNTRGITEDRIEEIVNKIYDELEDKQSREIEQDKVNSNGVYSNNTKNVKTTEVKEDRQPRPRNNLLRDLIRILLLRELLRRPHFPIRPPRPRYPGEMNIEPPIPRDYYI